MGALKKKKKSTSTYVVKGHFVKGYKRRAKA